MQFTTTHTFKMTFQEQIQQGIPSVLPKQNPTDINHAPKRKEILSSEEKNWHYAMPLRYFEPQHHAELIQEFSEELETYGRIYMYRLRPDYEMRARPNEYPENLNRPKPLC
jgi:urocanate hydratase